MCSLNDRDRDATTMAPVQAAIKSEWRKLPVPLGELCISTVLRCGQSFRWKLSGPDEWSCALKGRILSLRQDSSALHYRSIFPSHVSAGEDDTAELLRDYFNLSIDLTGLYATWSSRDANFSKKAPAFAGVRILRQDPWENVVSFICSSNNNIARISQMVANLCLTWGPRLGELEGTVYHDFPQPQALVASGVEQKLRGLGFGYRAKYIAAAAKMVVEDRPEGWLMGLREVGYREAHEALLQLPGVGPKVADCVCLMSLDKTGAVPVDTHVLQIAQRDYGFGKTKNKTLTKATYDAIGEHFRKLWGDEAGWAHSVLFTADLRAFSERLVVKTEETTETETVSTKKKRVRKEANGEGPEVVEEKKNKVKKVKVEVDLDRLEVATTLAERVKRRRR
ncbi:DNA glycosylase [Sphaerosporella brunnea]|uniref:N-glycosylase/DNA lyase n=1 Tax=Sphaerosporella brunnea TaxID=1250544 RepID=A0A5J5EEK0_9PEZI|nr:DNA glycosylase [Sphaerosporella brunnea]